MSATKFNSTSDPRRDIGFYNGAWRTPEGLALTTVEPNWDVNLPLGEKLINKLHGAMSFERGSIATTVNKSGIVEDVGIDEPAITKDGMSCYQSVENICIQSVDLSATGWLLGNGLARTQDSTLAPDQTSLAWILDKNGNTTANLLRRIDITDTGQSLVFSFYAKSKGSNVVRATLGLVPFLPVTLIDAEFDLDSGNWTKTDPAIHSTKTIKLIDDWWFISVHTNLTNLNNTQVSLYLSPAEASTSDMYFWRPQLAETDIHILPIETGSTSATRAADVASIPMSGNMPPAGEPFTIVIDCAIPDDGVARYVLDAGTPDTTNSLTFRRNSDGDVRFNIGPNSVTVSGIDDKTHRFIYTLDDPEEKLAVDGEISTNNVITALSYPLDEPLYIGGNRGIDGFLNSEVRNFHIVHRALSASEILALGGPDGILPEGSLPASSPVGFIASRSATYTFTTTPTAITTDIGATDWANKVDIVETPFDVGVDGGIRLLESVNILRTTASGYMKESGTATELVIAMKVWTPDKSDIMNISQWETVETFVVTTSSSNEGTIRFEDSAPLVASGTVVAFVGQIGAASGVTLESDSVLGNPVIAIKITMIGGED